MRSLQFTRELARALLVTAALCACTASTQAAAAYTGLIELQVDATDVQRRIYRVTESIPVRPGRYSRAAS